MKLMVFVRCFLKLSCMFFHMKWCLGEPLDYQVALNVSIDRTYNDECYLKDQTMLELSHPFPE
jgi:hypothetical protein